MSEEPEPSPTPTRSWTQGLHVLAVVLATAAAIGFMTGTRGDQSPYRRPTDPPAESAEALALTPSYAAIRSHPLGPNRDRHEAAIAAMRSEHPALTDAVAPRDDDAVRAELARRETLRAYNGAPPRIPHPIAPRGPLDCLGCHRDGARIGERIARPMSHAPELTSCTQCHVPDEGQMPGPRLPGGPPIDNAFVGLAAPERGPRMWDGAPPQIPHPTAMRERCASCHGVWGTGIRSTHPHRQSCEQCHTRSAALDQHPSTLAGGPPVAPMPGEAP